MEALPSRPNGVLFGRLSVNTGRRALYNADPMIDVYQSCYQLTDQAFRLSPDRRFSFAHPSYENARAYLKYAISQGEGFVAITGAPGTGKTTLIQSLFDEFDSDEVQLVTLGNLQIGEPRLLERILEVFEVPTGKHLSALSELSDFLISNYQRGCRSVIIVDEAQGMSAEMLEELRLLSNLQYNNQLLLQVFLVGQENLMDIVRAPGMEQLHQRLIAAAHLEPLQQDETDAYIQYRLQCVGWQGDPELQDETLKLIHKFSSGIPRRINLICHRLFLYGGLQGKHVFKGEDALHVIVELHKEGLLQPVSRRSLAQQE